MKILIVSPVALPLSSKLKYAGTERVISSLVAKLSSNPKIEIIVAASGDSYLPGVKFIFTILKSIWPLSGIIRSITRHDDTNERHFAFCISYALKNNVDIIHDHAGMILSKTYQKKKNELKIPVIMTLHGDPTTDDIGMHNTLRQLQAEKYPIRLASISKSQKRRYEKLAHIKVDYVVYNGLDVDQYPFESKVGKKDYLLWLGRVCPSKGTDLAIRVAKKIGMPLIIAGEVQTTYKDFYDKKVKKHITQFVNGDNDRHEESLRNNLIRQIVRKNHAIDPSEIIFMGPVDDKQKKKLFAHSRAFLALNRWHEPFGMVLTEAMATGTPVIGTKRGSIPEIVLHNKTGEVLSPIKDNDAFNEKALINRAVRAITGLAINPRACRDRVETYFSSDIMANNYLNIYKEMVSMT